MASAEQVYAVGRRKSSTARVFLSPGEGEILINNRPLNDYFGSDDTAWSIAVKQPLKALKVADQYNIKATAKGGGITGQAEALRLAIARALESIDPIAKQEGSDIALDSEEDMPVTWRETLKKAGWLSCDSRRVLRKRYGFRKARKKEQYSKR